MPQRRYRLPGTTSAIHCLLTYLLPCGVAEVCALWSAVLFRCFSVSDADRRDAFGRQTVFSCWWRRQRQRITLYLALGRIGTVSESSGHGSPGPRFWRGRVGSGLSRVSMSYPVFDPLWLRETDRSPEQFHSGTFPILPCSVRVEVRSGVRRVSIRVRVRFMVWVKGMPGRENV